MTRVKKLRENSDLDEQKQEGRQTSFPFATKMLALVPRALLLIAAAIWLAWFSSSVPTIFASFAQAHTQTYCQCTVPLRYGTLAET